jgi:zinc protease
MWTHPSVEDAVDCARLQVDLMERWVNEGVSEDEVAFAKSYLVKSHAFSVDTAEKRLDQRIEAAVLALPTHYHRDYLQRLSEVEADAVNTALPRRLDPSRLCLSILATAGDLEARLRESLSFDHFERRPFDQDG